MTSHVVREGYTEDIHWDVVSTMKVCWDILICMWIHEAVHANGDFLLTASPLTATDGELFTLTCSFHGESAVNIGWLLNNNAVFVSQVVSGCIKQQLAYGYDIINRTNVNCNSTAHSMEFRFNSTTDQGSAWQCGKSVNDYYIYPRSNLYKIDPVMSTLSLSTATRYMGTSDPGTVTTTDDADGHDNTASPVMSMQSSSTTTQNMETTTDQETVTTKDGEKDPNLLYIVVGAVGGGVLLTVVVVSVVCIRRRRRAAHQQNDMKEERNNKATRVYQNTSDCNTVNNDVYEGSGDVQPMNGAENQEDDLILSVSDIYTEVQKPKKKKQDYPMVSEDFNTGDVYAKPNKDLKAHK